MTDTPRAIRRIPRAAAFKVGTWLREQASAPAPRFGNSSEVATAIFKEFGIELDSNSVRRLCKDGGIPLEKLILHHSAGLPHPSRRSSKASSDSQLDRIEKMMETFLQSFGLVPPPKEPPTP